MNRLRILGLLLCTVLMAGAMSTMRFISAQESTDVTGAITTITLSDDSISIDGEGASAVNSVVTITAAGSYELSGTLADGQVMVDTQDEGRVSLVLNGIDIASTANAPLYVRNAESAALVLAEGTENILTSSAENSDDADFNAVIFSATDLSIEGSGSLTVEANALDGIVVSTNLTINDTPTITISGDEDAFKADGDAVVNGGDITVNVVGKGFNILYTLTVNDGTIDILNSDEGLEAGFITINDGNIHVVATDDGINISEPDDIPAPSLYMLTINGGYVVVSAEGDGIDSNGSIEMTGGVVIVNGPTANNNGALDYDGTFSITGGTLIAVGSAGMPAAPGQTSSQYSVLVAFDAVQEAGTLVHLQTSAGEDVVTFAPEKPYQSIVFSSPDLAEGAGYDVYTGGSAGGTATDGLYTSGTYTPGTLQSSFTVSDVITQVGNVRGFPGGPGGMGMPGGRPPR